VTVTRSGDTSTAASVITFQFDRATKKFSYDGAAWREILKHFPNSPEAVEARKHLDALVNKTSR